MATEWEDMRKQARLLEHEIDVKLLSFSKFGTSYSDHKDGSMSDTSPLLSNDHMFETMVVELEELLARLTHINDKMMDYTHSLGMNSGIAGLLHTLQRHREILQDYSNEFRKTKSKIQQERQRVELFGNVRQEMDGYRGNRKSDLYLKENEHLRNSERLIDEQINIAMGTKENLYSQRGRFSQITKRMQEMTKRFPVVNNLMTKVNFRKRRDTLIIGGVICSCIVFILWWIVR